MTKERVESIVRYIMRTYNDKNACVHVTTSGDSIYYLNLLNTDWECEDDVLHHSDDDGDVWIEYDSIVGIHITI